MSLRFILRLIEAFFKRFKGIIVIGAVVGFLFFLLIYFLLPNLDSTHDRVGVVGRFTTDNLPSSIANKLSKGLTSIDESGNVQPAIASSWESPDSGKTWTFYINENALWQDKKKVLASDIKYEFSDATSEIVDDKTIRFKLDSNFAAFPVIVSKPILKKGLVGAGEWEVKKISLTGGYLQKLIIEDIKNNKITYSFYPSEERLKLGLKMGVIDKIEKIQDPEPFDKWKTLSLEKEIGYDNFVGIFFNTEDEKLADKSIRQNLAYSIDKTIFGAERAISPISPNSWSYNPQVKPYDKDLSKAEDLKDLKIVLSTLPNLLKTAELIKKEWEAVGVICEIQVITEMPENYQALLATVDIPKDPDQYSLWHSTQTETNISRFKNARIDKLLEDGRTELNQDARKKIYLDFQRFLVEEVPTVFLYHPNFYTITRK